MELFDFNLLADRKKSFKQAKWNMTKRSVNSALRLAPLGFYPSPTDELPLGVTCFYCQKQFDSSENAFNLHLLNDPCVFAKLRRNMKSSDSQLQKIIDKCQVVEVDVSEELLKSFTNWPHGPGKTQTTPTAEEVAKAGFLNLKYDREADDVVCLSCSASLNEWEEGDDPLEEHRKRNPDCPFIMEVLVKRQDDKSDEVEKPIDVVAEKEKPAKVVKGTKRGRGRGKKVATETEAEVEAATETQTDKESEADNVVAEEVPEPSVVKKTKGKSKTTKRGKGKKIEEVVEPEQVDVKVVEVDLVEEVPETPVENAEVADAQEPSKSTDSERKTRGKRGKKEAAEPIPKRRKALESSTAANTPIPDKNDSKALLAYMEVIHDSTPVNSILTKEALLEIFEENSEKSLADFLGILGQKAGRLLDELMPIE